MSIRELNLKYWGDIHEICERTYVQPWECVRIEGRTFKNHPNFLNDNVSFDKAKFAVAIANKTTPLFVNDLIIKISDGAKFIVTSCGLKDFIGNIIDFDYLNYHEFRKDIGYNDILQKLHECHLEAYYSGEREIYNNIGSAINLIKELVKD